MFDLLVGGRWAGPIRRRAQRRQPKLFPQPSKDKFLDHGHMYDLGSEISYLNSESKERVALLKYVRGVQNGDAEFSQDTLIELIQAEDEHMRSQADEARVPDSDEEAMLRALMDASGPAT